MLRKSKGCHRVAVVEGRAFCDCAVVVPRVTGRHKRRFRGALELTDGLSMGYLKESRRGVLSFMGLFRAADAEGTIPPAEAAARADIFLAVNASSVELVDVERYCGEYVGARPLVLWNIELDTLRSDLGAPQGAREGVLVHALGSSTTMLSKAAPAIRFAYSVRGYTR